MLYRGGCSGNFAISQISRYLGCRNNSGSLAIFTAIRRASSRINSDPVLARFFAVPPVTALSVNTI